VTTLARTDEMATVPEPATVELILGAADLRILGGRGGVSSAAWAAVEGRPFAEVLGDGADVDDLAEWVRASGGDYQRSLDLKLGGDVLGLVAGISRVGGCVVIRGELRGAAADTVSDEQLTQHRLEELGVLVAGIAHDFNNILSAILGNAEFLVEGLDECEAVPPELGAAVADIMTAADRSRDLIAQMLGYAAKKVPGGAFSPVDITAMTVEMARLLRASIPPRISLQFATHAEVAMVLGDPSQLRQVIMNLIVNAADAITGAGTITIRSGTMYAESTLLAAGIGAERPVEGDYAFVECEDTGCGMSPATLEKIFDPFFTTKSKGRGLGLAGVRAIITGHGGRLLCGSTPGVGTVFRVFLPVVVAARASDVSASDLSSRSLEGYRLLVIDDEAMILRASARVLSVRGARVTAAADGHHGLELFAADPHAFDCVVLDVAMPFIDGIEVAQEARAMREDVPILFISGYGREEIQRRIVALDRVAFLEKPFSSTRLIAEISALVGGPPRAPEPT
jgi:two-component system cell cycle sensor histidine kinase/response regulator CckA